MGDKNIKSWVCLLAIIIVDVFIISSSFFLAYIMKFGVLSISASFVWVYLKPLVLVNLIWLIIFNLGGLYKLPYKEERGVANILATSFAITSAAFITLLLVYFLYKEAYYSISIILRAWIISLVLINIERLIVWKTYNKLCPK